MAKYQTTMVCPVCDRTLTLTWVEDPRYPGYLHYDRVDHPTCTLRHGTEEFFDRFHEAYQVARIQHQLGGGDG